MSFRKRETRIKNHQNLICFQYDIRFFKKVVGRSTQREDSSQRVFWLNFGDMKDQIGSNSETRYEEWP